MLTGIEERQRMSVSPTECRANIIAARGRQSLVPEIIRDHLGIHGRKLDRSHSWDPGPTTGYCCTNSGRTERKALRETRTAGEL